MYIMIRDKRTFEKKRVINKISSVIIKKNLYDAGSIEITQPSSIDVSVDEVIEIGNTGIFGIAEQVDGANEASTKIYCYDLKGLAHQRYVTEEITLESMLPEDMLYTLAVTFLKTGDRNIESLTVNKPEAESDTVIDEYTFGTGYLNEVLGTFCQKYDIGYDITYSGEGLEFNIIVPKYNRKCVFAKRYGNVSDISLSRSQYDYVNTVYVKTDEDIKIIGEGASGIDRFEGYADSEEDVNSYISEHAIKETLQSTANGRYTYGVDYSLGDSVNVMYGEYITRKTISEVEIVYENAVHVVTPTFGDVKANPIKKILRGEK